ncbi:hypothetical protein VPH35_059708 [Triticum aestivum]|uniref:Uncharacterized protein n=1 Tax=Aegilops tauschii TaxID=37682 RepID=R7WAN3_AEGTA
MKSRQSTPDAQQSHTQLLQSMLEEVTPKHFWPESSDLKNLIDMFRSKINEKSIYAFSNFKVVESTKYRPVSNEIKIFFHTIDRLEMLYLNDQVEEVKELMDDKVDTMLMKKQNMPDKKVIDFLTIHTLDFRDVSNF